MSIKLNNKEACLLGTPMVIYRIGTILVIPLLLTFIGKCLGYHLAEYMIRNNKYRHYPYEDIHDTAKRVQAPLVLAALGGIVGLVIDAGLLLKWTL